MPLDSKKEDRSEYVSLYVTKKLAIELEQMKDNQTAKESIIKNYLTSEKDWLASEMQGIDDATLKYSTKLLGNKENFEIAHSIYVERVENIYSVANKTFDKFDSVVKPLEQKLDKLHTSITHVMDRVGYINVERLERMITALDTFEKMTIEQKDIIKLLLEKK